MAAEKCAVFIGNDPVLAPTAIEALCQGSSLLAAKRLLADATSQAEKHIF
jgi:hypothetical protein